MIAVVGVAGCGGSSSNDEAAQKASKHDIKVVFTVQGSVDSSGTTGGPGQASVGGTCYPEVSTGLANSNITVKNQASEIVGSGQAPISGTFSEVVTNKFNARYPEGGTCTLTMNLPQVADSSFYAVSIGSKAPVTVNQQEVVANGYEIRLTPS
jgi:hypothetical protein